MSVENSTPNRGYQLPFGSNNLEDDVLRLIAALSAIDVDVAGLLVSVAQRALLVHSHVIADTTGLQAALDAKQDESEKGNANGYASLGSDGKVPAAQLPSTLFGSLNYQGDWNANTNTPTIPAAAAGNKGWYYMVSVAGAASVGGITDWKVGDWAVSDGTKWVKIDNTDAVASVAGLTGAITAAALKTALAIAVADVAGANNAANLTTGTLPDARLPARLGLVCQTVTDANTATANGWYMGSAMANAPSASWWLIETVTHIEALWCVQTAYPFTAMTAASGGIQRRVRTNGTWGAWFSVIDHAAELDARYLRMAADAILTAGYTGTDVSDGAKTTGTYTPAPAGGNFRSVTNNGAHTLAAPTAAGSYSIIIDYTNGATAGVITVSGFTKVTGDAFTTTNGSKFRLFISKGQAGTHLHVQALQ
ncbi:pyocin knob domain-containing protein [Mesorhizobium sp. CA4]|uniref:pyocin knob domain-containing protein n=1 Tax=Mesorhizobium sp. CA4 TaxID=588499 RepID=UPI001CD143DD|nr:pyocin knob domain-containing protein [Mesorhizobium sp. CA4]MBZ9822346.1 pyocin knob domain-containing protein [Mesorhizobium sp. CA4]